MSVRDEILKGPESIAYLKKEGKTLPAIADAIFVNFMYYARHHWKYQASSKKGGTDLLDGYTGPVPCGGIANALRIMLEEAGVPKGPTGVSYVTISGYVWTKAEYLCFDRDVKGNVRRAESPGVFDQGCFFNEHYFLKCYLKYYDPCLSSVYAAQDDAIRMRLPVSDIIVKGVLLPGDTPGTYLVFNGDEVVPGWERGTWMIVPGAEILRYVTEKNELLSISVAEAKGRVTKDLVKKARGRSRELFVEAGRLEYWVNRHREAGITVT